MGNALAQISREYLESNNQRLKATKTVWYYYAEATDESGWKWAGDATTAYLNGRALKMRKLTDKEGDNDWFTTCE